MDKKFHINKNTQKLVKCKAIKKKCPRVHFSSVEEYNVYMLENNQPKSLLEEYEKLRDSVKMVTDPNTKLTTISYLHAGVDFSNPLIRMARALTLDKNGNVVTRGFQKFFNYLQLENYEQYNEDFKNQFARLTVDPLQELFCREKVDGSLAVTGIHNGELVVSTTSSTNNEFSDKIKNILRKIQN